jgi:hypothetical protein
MRHFIITPMLVTMLASVFVLVGCGGGGGGGEAGGTPTDSVSPAIQSIAISNADGSSNDAVTVEVEVTDNVAVTAVTVELDNAALLSAELPAQTNFFILSKGSGNTWSNQVIRLAGNGSTDPVPFTVTARAADARPNTTQQGGNGEIPVDAASLPPGSF